MFGRHTAAEIEGMPHSKPFAWLLVVGTLCSLAGLMVVWLPGAKNAAEPASPPDTSAFEAVSSAASNTVQTVVTQESPPSPEAAATEPAPTEPVDAAVAQVAVTPTPAPMPEGAPDTTAQSILASLFEPVEVPRTPEKAHALFDAMNDARREAGLAALEWDSSLEEVSYARAANLVANGYFDHYAPDGESAFSELAARGIGYRLAGENLARNNYVEPRTVGAAFEGLMNSPGHRANILEGRFSSVGVACVKEGKMWIYVMVFVN